MHAIIIISTNWFILRHDTYNGLHNVTGTYNKYNPIKQSDNLSSENTSYVYN